MQGAKIVFPLRFAAGGQAVQTTTRELSVEGVYVRCLVPPEVGTPLGMKLYLPGSPLADTVSGIVRAVFSGGAREAGFWAEFVSLGERERVRIEEVLEGKARAAESVPIGTMNLKSGRPASEPAAELSSGSSGQAAGRAGRTAEPPAPADPRRTFPRYNARFAVRFASVQDFVLEYAANISAGGVFVQTEAPPDLETVVRVAMELPGGGLPVEAKAVVVHRVTVAEARAAGTVPGVGVQFVDSDDTFRERIDYAIASILDEQQPAR